jgi:hypothetical protein
MRRIALFLLVGLTTALAEPNTARQRTWNGRAIYVAKPGDSMLGGRRKAKKRTTTTLVAKTTAATVAK